METGELITQNEAAAIEKLETTATENKGLTKINNSIETSTEDTRKHTKR